MAWHAPCSFFSGVYGVSGDFIVRLSPVDSLRLSHSVLNNGFFQACTTCSLLPPAAAAATPAASLLGRKFAMLLLINSLLAARLYYGHIMLQYGVFTGCGHARLAMHRVLET